MSAVRLSFIVPIYNVECYLEECINSILDQKVDRSEIILVNDGSTDESLSICINYEKKYPFIHLINQQNAGISSARNVGLMAARGKYICFIDSDDFFRISFAENFLNICEQYDLDIIRGWYGIYEDCTGEYSLHPQPQITYMNKVCNGREFLRYSIKEHANEVVPWLGFFKREYLLRNSILFPEGIAYEEDQLFFLQALIRDKTCRIMQSDVEFYAYRKRQGSATKTPTYKQAEDIIYVVKKETEELEKYSLSKRDKKAALKYITSSFYQLTSIYGRVDNTDKKKIVKSVSFKMKWQCMRNPYDRHQWIKIFLFTFARWIVDIVYRGRAKE